MTFKHAIAPEFNYEGRSIVGGDSLVISATFLKRSQNIKKNVSAQDTYIFMGEGPMIGEIPWSCQLLFQAFAQQNESTKVQSLGAVVNKRIPACWLNIMLDHPVDSG